MNGNLIAAGITGFISIVAMLLVPLLLVLAAFNLDQWVFYALLAVASLIAGKILGGITAYLAGQHARDEMRWLRREAKARGLL